MSNYKAIVANVERVVPIEGRDKIHIAFVLGEQVIVSKEVQPGYTGVLFISGTQLSVDYCKHNNLFRDSTLNVDSTKTGYFDANRRVRAQPFAKVRSEAYFADLDSLKFTGVDLTTLTVGTSFEDLNGVNVCKKYLNEKAMRIASGNKNKTKVRVKEMPLFKEHVDTSHFMHNTHRIQAGDLVSIQAKIHGTSARYGFTKVSLNLPKWKQLINKFVPLFKTEQWEYVAGTRRVVLNEPEKVGFHGVETYRFEWLEKLKPHLIKGMTVYGEIAGYANGKPIMATHDLNCLKDAAYTNKYGKQITYKYGCLPDTNRFHVYRITITNDDGDTIDYTEAQIHEWCKQRGFNPPLEVHQQFVYDGDVEKLKALVTELTERPDKLTEDYIDPSHISEGVIVRVDNGQTQPLFLKHKSYAFKVAEGIAAEKEVDVEDVS